MARTNTANKASVEADTNNKQIDLSKKEPQVPTEIDTSELITVKNGFQGKLVYISKRTGEKFVWDEFGDEQEIELRELRNVKNTAKEFFTNNWFMFNDEDMWIPGYLGVGQYYKGAVKIDDFDSIFTKTPAQVTKIVSGMTDGQKESLEYRARQLVSENGIDSNKVIEALEKALDTQLIDR